MSKTDDESVRPLHLELRSIAIQSVAEEIQIPISDSWQREGGWDGGKEGWRDGGREGGMEKWREGGRDGEMEGGRDGQAVKEDTHEEREDARKWQVYLV